MRPSAKSSRGSFAALASEEKHLLRVRGWLEEQVLAQAQA